MYNFTQGSAKVHPDGGQGWNGWTRVYKVYRVYPYGLQGLT